MSGLKNLTYAGRRLCFIGIESQELRRLLCDLICIDKMLSGLYRLKNRRVFYVKSGHCKTSADFHVLG